MLTITLEDMLTERRVTLNHVTAFDADDLNVRVYQLINGKPKVTLMKYFLVVSCTIWKGFESDEEFTTQI